LAPLLVVAIAIIKAKQLPDDRSFTASLPKAYNDLFPPMERHGTDANEVDALITWRTNNFRLIRRIWTSHWSSDKDWSFFSSRFSSYRLIGLTLRKKERMKSSNERERSEFLEPGWTRVLETMKHIPSWMMRSSLLIR